MTHSTTKASAPPRARVPRYTSYPTAPHFRFVSHEAARAALERCGDALSLYVHVPFCQRLCWYCGCHTEITRRTDRADEYVSGVLAELDLVLRHVPPGRTVHQLALGGGTPTFLTPEQMTRLVEGLSGRLSFAPAAERSVEIDPRSVDERYVDRLVGLGFNRFSIGVQDFDMDVLRAVHREQPEALTVAVLDRIRHHGDYSVNFDLLYGLPMQTVASFAHTVDRVIELGPDRLSVFPYAHVPSMKPAQRLLSRQGLPDQAERTAMFAMTRDKLERAGYRRVGMDHFAREGDSLLQALDSGTLHRNFQGYTTLADLELIGLGASSISWYGGIYAQNTKDRVEWSERVRAGRLPVERGVVLTDDDLVRRALIMTLMCNGTVRWADLAPACTSDRFRAEIARLTPFVASGLVDVSPDGIDLTPAGKEQVMRICAVFDAYRDPALDRVGAGGPPLAQAIVRHASA